MFKRSGKEDLYTALAELPVPTSAFFQNPGHDGVLDRSGLAAFVAQITCKVIHVTFSKQDHERNVTRSISKSIFVTSPNTSSSTLAQDASDIKASTVSPSKSRVAILRQTSDQDKKRRYIEIWADDRLEASQEVSSTHGTFLTGGKSVSSNGDAS